MPRRIRRQTPTIIDWKTWEWDQNRAERVTIFERSHRPPYDNRIVPRQASCHYYAEDPNHRNVYFY